MSLICKALVGSQLNWHRQEKKQPICWGLIRSLAAWSQGHGWYGVFLFQTSWSWRSRKYAPPWWQERGEQFLQMTNYMLWAQRKRETEGVYRQTEGRNREREDIIYTYVSPMPADEKSHHVRPGFDACYPQMRQLADILWVRRLFDQHFRRDINISVW